MPSRAHCKTLGVENRFLNCCLVQSPFSPFSIPIIYTILKWARQDSDLRPSDYESGGSFSIASTLVQYPYIWGFFTALPHQIWGMAVFMGSEGQNPLQYYCKSFVSGVTIPSMFSAASSGSGCRHISDCLKTGDIFLRYLIIYPVGRFLLTSFAWTPRGYWNQHQPDPVGHRGSRGSRGPDLAAPAVSFQEIDQRKRAILIE